jgi:hypothetical protein
MRSVRPKIRAAEIGLSSPDMGFNLGPWPKEFWRECWEKTRCIPAPLHQPEAIDTREVVERLVEIYALVADHFHNSLSHTDIDARCDSVFGLVLYGVKLAFTLNQGRVHTRIEGRLAIRTLTETYVTLAFLLHRDDPALWLKYRKYGGGQAKLAFLKMFDMDAEEVPEYINMAELEMFANEDAGRNTPKSSLAVGREPTCGG